MSEIAGMTGVSPQIVSYLLVDGPLYISQWQDSKTHQEMMDESSEMPS